MRITLISFLWTGYFCNECIICPWAAPTHLIQPLTADSSQNMLSKGPFTPYLSGSITVTRSQSKTCFKLCEFWSRKQMHCVFESGLWSKIFRKFFDRLSSIKFPTNHESSHNFRLVAVNEISRNFHNIRRKPRLRPYSPCWKHLPTFIMPNSYSNIFLSVKVLGLLTKRRP